MRSLHSFLISLNAHIWGIWLLSLVFVVSGSEPRPQRIEVQLLKLPAPVEGDSGALLGISLPRASPCRPDPEAALRATSGQEDGRRQRAPGKRGPRVTYRVRVAQAASAIAVRDSGTWIPASGIRLRPSAECAPGSRISGVSPEAPPARGGIAPARASYDPPAAEHGSLATTQRSPARDNEPVSMDEAIGGDTRSLIEIIQARIDAITPLIHATAGPCQTEKGIVRLRFIINPAGYPCGFRIVASSGVRCLDDEVDNVLHMAEPYPYVAGWIPVTVRFSPRTRI
jgi:hypothetical protein